jgi:hypothetical protein
MTTRSSIISPAPAPGAVRLSVSDLDDAVKLPTNVSNEACDEMSALAVIGVSRDPTVSCAVASPPPAGDRLSRA